MKNRRICCSYCGFPETIKWGKKDSHQHFWKQPKIVPKPYIVIVLHSSRIGKSKE